MTGRHLTVKSESHTGCGIADPKPFPLDSQSSVSHNKPCKTKDQRKVEKHRARPASPRPEVESIMMGNPKIAEVAVVARWVFA